MDATRTFRFALWPLLLILAAAGFWYWDSPLSSGTKPSAPVTMDGELTLAIAEGEDRVRVEGLSPETLQFLRQESPDLSGTLQVYALPEGQQWDSGLIATDGTWSTSDAGIDFISRHPWLPGVTYHARLNRGELYDRLGQNGTAGAVIDTSFTIPGTERGEMAYVNGIYPSADTLPQNLLKFYIHFSQPMTRGEVYRHISILDEDGEKVPDAFLELPQELWDPQARRLTILFDPGRIKRGLERHNLLGVAFQPGQRYTLAVDSTLRDGNGYPLSGSFRKSFVISEPDRQMPDHKAWTITTPEAGSTDPLELRFDEPMDRALVRRLISVKRNGREVAGTVELSDAERVWRFLPESEWRAGRYELETGRVVEDLAGNNLISVFDVDLAEEDPTEEDVAGSVISREFRIMP